MNWKQSFVPAIGLVGAIAIVSAMVQNWSLGQPPTPNSAEVEYSAVEVPLDGDVFMMATVPTIAPLTTSIDGDQGLPKNTRSAPFAATYGIPGPAAFPYAVAPPAQPVAPSAASARSYQDFFMFNQRYHAVDQKDAERTRKSIALARKIVAEGSSSNDKEELQKQLRAVLREQFEERQNARRNELLELKERVAKLEDSLAIRDGKKDEIIERRFNELLMVPDPTAWEIAPNGQTLQLRSSFAPRLMEGMPAEVSSPLYAGAAQIEIEAIRAGKEMTQAIQKAELAKEKALREDARAESMQLTKRRAQELLQKIQELERLVGEKDDNRSSARSELERVLESLRALLESQELNEAGNAGVPERHGLR